MTRMYARGLAPLPRRTVPAGATMQSAPGLTLGQMVAAAVTLVLVPVAAQAVGAGAGLAMPWIAPLQGLLDTLSGPTARVIAGLAFVIGAGLLALGRAEEGAKKFGMVVVGASIAIAAANVVNAFAFAGAVVGG